VRTPACYFYFERCNNKFSNYCQGRVTYSGISGAQVKEALSALPIANMAAETADKMAAKMADMEKEIKRLSALVDQLAVRAVSFQKLGFMKSHVVQDSSKQGIFLLTMQY
jgi:hypothetical protein